VRDDGGPGRDKRPPAPSLWSPEGRALVAALRARLGFDASPQPQSVDWASVLALAEIHRVEALLEPTLLGGLGAGSEIVEIVKRRRRELTITGLARLALQHRLLDALRGADVDVVVLKGAPLAAEAFGSPFARHDVDVDLLVAPHAVARAAAVLEQLGLRWIGWGLPDARQTSLADGVGRPLLPEAIFKGGGQWVELHWRLTRNRRLMPVTPEWLTAPRYVQVDGRPTSVLPEIPAFLHLAVHGTLHRWQRLKWLVDLPALVAQRPALLESAVLAEAQERGLERCLATGLQFAERVLGPFLPSQAREWARRSPGTGILLRQSTIALGAGHSAPGEVRPWDLPTHAAGRFAVRADRGFRTAEARSMLLEAAGAHTEPYLGARTAAAAPVRWIARSVRRAAS